MRAWPLALVLAVCVTGCGDRAAPESTRIERGTRDGVVAVDAGDAAMRDAIAAARASLDGFLRLAADPAPHLRRFSVKIGLAQGGRTEFVWLEDVRVEGDAISGTLASSPQWVDSVRRGERLRVGRNDVVDWFYVDTRDGRMYGNRTTCALLARGSDHDASAYMRTTGLRCDDLR